MLMMMMMMITNQYFKKSSFKDNYKYESRGDKDKKLSVKQYLYKIMPYLSNIINDHKAIGNKSNKSKIQINMHVNFISSKNIGETHTIYVWSDNEEIRLASDIGQKGHFFKKEGHQKFDNPLFNCFSKGFASK